MNATVIDSDKHRSVARESAAASVVLLRNHGGVLPLTMAAKIAAIGPWFDPSLQPSMSRPTNAYVHSYAGTSSVMVNFLDGITARADTPPTFVQGCRTNQTSTDDPNGTFAAARAAALAAEFTVVALGLTTDVSDAHGVGHEAEMRDRVSLALPQVQLDLLAAVREVAHKVVLVIVAGSAVLFKG